jgi:hypothetical protein
MSRISFGAVREMLFFADPVTILSEAAVGGMVLVTVRAACGIKHQ